MQAHNSPSSKMSPRRRLSSAISRLSLTKAKAQILPSGPPTEPFPAEFPFPALHSHSQTMKNYDYQRSNKIPHRAPAPFPANLNFSQRIIFPFDSSEDKKDDSLNYNLDNITLGSNQSAPREKNQKSKKVKCSTTDHKLHLPTLKKDYTKNKRFNLSIFPRKKSEVCPLPSKSSFKTLDQSFSQTVTSTKVPPSPTSLLPILSLSHTFEPPQSHNMVPCPQIGMVLTSSPLLNSYFPTLSMIEAPSTPPIGCLSCEMCAQI